MQMIHWVNLLHLLSKCFHEDAIINSDCRNTVSYTRENSDRCYSSANNASSKLARRSEMEMDCLCIDVIISQHHVQP